MTAAISTVLSKHTQLKKVARTCTRMQESSREASIMASE